MTNDMDHDLIIHTWNATKIKFHSFFKQTKQKMIFKLILLKLSNKIKLHNTALYQQADPK